jgi:membrane protease YdiL (CAAX protease family)
MKLALPVRAGGGAHAATGWLLMIAALLLLALALAAATGQPGRVLVLLVLAPLAEEAIFRTGLQEALLRRGAAAWLSNVVTAVAFAAAHVLVRGDPAAAVLVVPGLLIGALYARRRNLRDCVALHALMNAAWLAWSIFVTAGALLR